MGVIFRMIRNRRRSFRRSIASTETMFESNTRSGFRDFLNCKVGYEFVPLGTPSREFWLSFCRCLVWDFGSG